MENNKELTIQRTYDAAPEAIWKAWTDPELLKQWWGPNDVLIPECEVDLRVGGKFYIVMEAGERMGPYKGTKWPMSAEFTVVKPQAQISYTAHAWTEGQEEKTFIDQTTEITISPVGSKTNVEIKVIVHEIGPDAKMAIMGMQAGFTQQLEKLDGFLKK